LQPRFCGGYNPFKEEKKEVMAVGSGYYIDNDDDNDSDNVHSRSTTVTSADIYSLLSGTNEEKEKEKEHKESGDGRDYSNRSESRGGSMTTYHPLPTAAHFPTTQINSLDRETVSFDNFNRSSSPPYADNKDVTTDAEEREIAALTQRLAWLKAKRAVVKSTATQSTGYEPLQVLDKKEDPSLKERDSVWNKCVDRLAYERERENLSLLLHVVYFYLLSSSSLFHHRRFQALLAMPDTEMKFHSIAALAHDMLLPFLSHFLCFVYLMLIRSFHCYLTMKCTFSGER
jgi:hypothetical protein